MIKLRKSVVNLRQYRACYFRLNFISSNALPKDEEAESCFGDSSFHHQNATVKRRPRSMSQIGEPFRLSDSFVSRYSQKKAPFGFNGLGEVVYLRTYSRPKSNGDKEQWFETVERVVNGTYNMQKRWIEEHSLGWDKMKAQLSAQKMYDKIFNMKFLPPGRGLWAMGSPLTEERGLFAALNNCAFVSTENMWDTSGGQTPSKPFCFLMDASMLGVGVGFDTKGANDRRAVIFKPDDTRQAEVFVIPDSREGWVESVRKLIDSYFVKSPRVEFNYDKIRPAGSVIHGFGGVASGSGPLKELHDSIRSVLDSNVGHKLSITCIVDLMNMIGKCVISGNIRRSAEIAFGDPNSEEYVDLKNYEKNPQRIEYGWTSNNSVLCDLGMDYGKICDRVAINGEPGFAWLENARAYGRMGDVPDHKDRRASGGNPCLEQTLESYELCCLVETFPHNHQSLDEFTDTLKYAYLYAKTVTLGATHWPETNRVTLRNRRIGCSMSGLAQFIESRSLGELKSWCEQGYRAIQNADVETSDWLAIPRSIKTTSIKPSGTVSIVAGATPGMHYPEHRFCRRRMRLAKHSDLVDPLLKAGYKIEPCIGDEDNTSVVEFPIDFGPGVRSLDEVSMWEQLSLAAFLQKYWSDNQVSCTVTFDPENEGPHLKNALDYFQYQLKGISFLPRLPKGAYQQMPIEAINERTFQEMSSKIDKRSLKEIKGDFIRMANAETEIDKYCDGDRSCNNV